MIGTIYKIIHSQSDIIYIGSTTQILSQRWRFHKNAFNLYLNDKSQKHISIYKYIEQYDIKDFKIVKIKEYEVCDKKHLEVYEQLWINKSKCVNMTNPFRIPKLSAKTYADNNKDKRKEYELKNKEKIAKRASEYNKKRYQEKQAEYIERAKEYAINNKDKIKEYKKEHYQKNKEEITKKNKELYICICGVEMRKDNKTRHEKSGAHKKFITSL